MYIFLTFSKLMGSSFEGGPKYHLLLPKIALKVLRDGMPSKKNCSEGDIALAPSHWDTKIVH